MNKKQLIDSLRNKGVSEKILKAFLKVPREEFVEDYLRDCAYEDKALPSKEDSTISQPYTVAFMLDLLDLRRGQKVLEIGSGSGYVLALLSELTDGEIIGIEILVSLVESSRKLLDRYKNVSVNLKDGAFGFIDKAPFDRILISASLDEFPKNLYSQLKENGIIVAPIKNSIFKISKQSKGVDVEEFPGFAFVPFKYS